MAEGDFDVVHVEHLRGAVYGLHVNGLQSNGLQSNGLQSNGLQSNGAIPVVWDSVDSISHLFAQASQTSRSLKGRLMTSIDLARTRRHEAWLIRQFSQVLVTSKHDRDALLGLPAPADAADIPAEQVRVLPNGVDLDYFTPGNEPREQASIVFSGKMSYHANITAAIHLVEDVMPAVWAKSPDVKVYLVGKDPTPAVRNLARKDGADHGEVIVTGTVPDMRPYLRRAALAVAPIAYGAGIQNKVLEALACGAPVVTTPQAVSALAIGEDEGVRVGATAADLAEAILDLLGNEAKRRQLADSGRSYVTRRHDWANIVADLVDIYTESMARSAAPMPIY
ncbi:MAG: glycosyltransferase [Caldilineaceae bacterium]